jgi:hypothetical protein
VVWGRELREPWRVPRIACLLLVCLAAFAFVACEKPDRSYVTSPTVKTLIGTTTGNTAFNAPETPPPAQDPPDRWEVNFGLARWSELENGSPALELVMQVATRPGAGMEIWLENEGRTIARWSAGSTASYVGTVCFQLELETGGEAVPLGQGIHTATLAFRDPGSGVIASRKLDVTHNLPKLEGGVPSPTSEVMREALACRRGQ